MRHEQEFGIVADKVAQQLCTVIVSEVSAHPGDAAFEFDTAAGIHQHFAVVVAFQHQCVAAAQFPADIFRSRRNQDKLSPAKFNDAAPVAAPVIEDSELPFM